MGSLLLVFGILILLNTLVLTPVSYWFQDSLLAKLEIQYAKTLNWALQG